RGAEDVVEGAVAGGELRDVALADDDRTGRLQLLHHGVRCRGHMLSEDRRAEGAAHARDFHVVLHGDRKPVQEVGGRIAQRLGHQPARVLARPVEAQDRQRVRRGFGLRDAGRGRIHQLERRHLALPEEGDGFGGRQAAELLHGISGRGPNEPRAGSTRRAVAAVAWTTASYPIPRSSASTWAIRGSSAGVLRPGCSQAGAISGESVSSTMPSSGSVWARRRMLRARVNVIAPPKPSAMPRSTSWRACWSLPLKACAIPLTGRKRRSSFATASTERRTCMITGSSKSRAIRSCSTKNRPCRSRSRPGTK